MYTTKDVYYNAKEWTRKKVTSSQVSPHLKRPNRLLEKQQYRGWVNLLEEEKNRAWQGPDLLFKKMPIRGCNIQRLQQSDNHRFWTCAIRTVCVGLVIIYTYIFLPSPVIFHIWRAKPKLPRNRQRKNPFLPACLFPNQVWAQRVQNHRVTFRALAFQKRAFLPGQFGFLIQRECLKRW